MKVRITNAKDEIHEVHGKGKVYIDEKVAQKQSHFGRHQY
jgi:hypothetical protein